MPERFLIVESERDGVKALRAELERATTRKTEIESVTGESGLREMLRQERPFDLIVASYRGDGDDQKPQGPKLAKLIRRADPSVPIVLTHPSDDPVAAALAIKAGASEFLVCDDLVERVDAMLRKARGLAALHQEQRALEEQNNSLRQAAQERFTLVGSSPQMEELRERILQLATVPRPVLVVGERGTGKELVARALHDNSDRASKPFVAVNCAALAESLIESELFGHEKGAFTGAHARRAGKFEEADQGTIFLDEIGSMSLAAQHKILRVAEYGTLRRVGSSGETRIDVRIVSATNADLAARIQEGAFLADLYDRLAFEVLEVAPLRDRIADLALLSQHFLDRFMREVPTFHGKRLTADALRMLEAYNFPGNVRELRNIIERAVCRDTTNEIAPEDIGLISSSERRGRRLQLQGTHRELRAQAATRRAGRLRRQPSPSRPTPRHDLPPIPPPLPKTRVLAGYRRASSAARTAARWAAFGGGAGYRVAELARR